jgi:hypothetical protein
MHGKCDVYMELSNLINIMNMIEISHDLHMTHYDSSASSWWYDNIILKKLKNLFLLFNFKKMKVYNCFNVFNYIL